ncbi:butyrophilin subfamily 1 member A1-like [Phaenicophaeus curvirostris]|uniref:butyrophilin subfamily 1 member A1-like n=1 Tax=Phaenicophaeus curvirostris TaxID=33595 RepID=UPI0037F0DD19
MWRRVPTSSTSSSQPTLTEKRCHLHPVKRGEKMMVSSCSHLLLTSSILIFFSGFHIHELDGASFKVLGPDHPITAVVGEDVVLPCHLHPGLNAEKMEVRWFRSRFSVYVHLYQGGRDHFSSQLPQYQERTQFLKDGVSAGNVSLRILRTRLSDEGQYQCLVKDGDFYEEATVELKAAVSGSSPVLSVEGYQAGGIRLGCRGTGWYPKPEVLWWDSRRHRLPSLSDSDFQDQDGLFEVKKSIVIQRDADRNVSCSIRNTRLLQEKDATIDISAVVFPRESPWMVALFATLAAGVVSFVAFILLVLRLRAQQAVELKKRDVEIRERDAEIEKHVAELRWRNIIVPVEEVHVTLDEDTAHPQLILWAGGTKVRRGDTRRDVPANPERYDTYHCVLGHQVFSCRRHFWEVDVGTEEGGVWAMGVAKETMKRKGWINPAPQDGILALFFCGGKFWALTSPDHTALNPTKKPQVIRIYLDFEEQQVAFFNAHNQELLFTFPLAPLGGEKIRPWFRVGPIAQLSLKAPPPPPPQVSSAEETLLRSCYPCKVSLRATKTHTRHGAGAGDPL